MHIGLFTPVFAHIPFDDLLTELKSYPAVTSLEIGTGGWPGSAHLDLRALLKNKESAREFLGRLADAGIAISALSCHSNPLHPEGSTAAAAHTLFKDTVRLAERLQVQTVVTFSGCPGGSPTDTSPNWITAAWPPEYQQMLAWQWEKKLIPYWRKAEAFARSAGIRVALEAHPGFCVYNPETLLKLRAATGRALGINFDPSHFWWQGIDPVAAIERLRGAIFHVHAKDVALNPANVAANGVLDTKSFTDLHGRSWIFRSVGWGHSEDDWKRIVSALRLAGYDGVLSIEHEDALASVREGLLSAVDMLSRVVLREAPATPWWT